MNRSINCRQFKGNYTYLAQFMKGFGISRSLESRDDKGCENFLPKLFHTENVERKPTRLNSVGLLMLSNRAGRATLPLTLLQ